MKFAEKNISKNYIQKLAKNKIKQQQQQKKLQTKNIFF